MKKLSLNNGYLKVDIADRFWSRLRGLLGTQSLAREKCLLIAPCNSVHMLGMRYAIDVAYLDDDNKIIKIVENLRPWTGCSICLKAKNTLELARGAVQYYDLQVGQILEIEE